MTWRTPLPVTRARGFFVCADGSLRIGIQRLSAVRTGPRRRSTGCERMSSHRVVKLLEVGIASRPPLVMTGQTGDKFKLRHCRQVSRVAGDGSRRERVDVGNRHQIVVGDRRCREVAQCREHLRHADDRRQRGRIDGAGLQVGDTGNERAKRRCVAGEVGLVGGDLSEPLVAKLRPRGGRVGSELVDCPPLRLIHAAQLTEVCAIAQAPSARTSQVRRHRCGLRRC